MAKKGVLFNGLSIGQKLIIIMASHGVLQCHMRALQAFRALLIGLRLVLERPVQALRVLFNGI